MYIANIREKFGSFHFAQHKTVFNPALYDQYMLRFITGVACAEIEIIEKTSVSMSKSTTEPAPKKRRIIDRTENQQTQITQSDDNNDSGIDISTQNTDQTAATSDEDQVDTSLIADSTGLSHEFEQIDDEFQSVITRITGLKSVSKSQTVTLKHEISALKEAHAEEIAALKQTHRQMLADANNEADLARKRITILETKINDHEQVLAEFKSEIAAEKQRTLRARQREQKYRDKLIEIGNAARAMTRHDEIPLGQNNTQKKIW